MTTILSMWVFLTSMSYRLRHRYPRSDIREQRGKDCRTNGWRDAIWNDNNLAPPIFRPEKPGIEPRGVEAEEIHVLRETKFNAGTELMLLLLLFLFLLILFIIGAINILLLMLLLLLLFLFLLKLLISN